MYNGKAYPDHRSACIALLKADVPDNTYKTSDPPDEYGHVHCVGQKDGEVSYDQYQNGIEFVKEVGNVPEGAATEEPPPVSPTEQPPDTLPNCTAKDSPGKTVKPAKNDGSLPVMEYDYTQYPQIGCGILMAQKAGWPAVLTYDTFGDTGSERRRCKRQKRRENITNSGVSTSRSVSADEYPFASTVENQGSTFISSVPASEQNSQGGKISAFYGQYREQILSAKPFYFEVKVTNIPNTAQCGNKASVPK